MTKTKTKGKTKTKAKAKIQTKIQKNSSKRDDDNCGDDELVKYNCNNYNAGRMDRHDQTNSTRNN